MKIPQKEVMRRLTEKMKAELADYEQDYYADKKPYRLSKDKRYLFMLEMSDEIGGADLARGTALALLSIDGLLMFCWDVWCELNCDFSAVPFYAARCVRNGEV